MADTLTGADLPWRTGPRPRTTETTPHSQLDQQPADLLNEALARRGSGLGDVVVDGSRRSPPGTVGLHLPAAAARNDERIFLIDREFAHIHPDDGSLHLILPEPLRSAAIQAGWAEPHPLAGQPTTSPDTVMVYVPRDTAELDTVASLVEASWRNAHR